MYSSDNSRAHQRDHMRQSSVKWRVVSRNSPTSKDWSISRKRFVLFSAMALSAVSEEEKSLLLPSSSPVNSCPSLSYFWWIFLSLCLPTLSPLLPCSLSLFRTSVCLPSEGDSAPRRAGLAANFASCLVYGSGKLHCHISCFSAWN